MKITAQEEYGMRCLLRLGQGSLTIGEIASAEHISTPYVAKLMRVLRKAGLVQSVRGQLGGYRLTRPLDQITVAEALAVLGGRLYDPEFCAQHTCGRPPECSVRSLWHSLQEVVDQVLVNTTLKQLTAQPQPAAQLVHIQ